MSTGPTPRRPRQSLATTTAASASTQPATPPSSSSSRKSAETLHLEQRVRFLATREQQLARTAERLEAALRSAEERFSLKAAADSARLRAELQAAIGRAADLQQQLSARDASAAAAVADADARRDEAVSAMREMAAAAEAQIAEFAQLRRDRAAAVARVAELEQNCAQLRADAAQMAADVEARWRSDLGAGEEHRRAAEENRRLAAALDEARAETRRVAATNERLLAQLGARVQHFRETRELVDGLAREREAVSRETERLSEAHRAETEELSRKLEAARAEADRLREVAAAAAAATAANEAEQKLERFDASAAVQRAERLYALALEDGGSGKAVAQLKGMRASLGEKAVQLTGTAKQLRASLVPLEADVGEILAAAHLVQRCIAASEQPPEARAEFEALRREAAETKGAGGIGVEDLPQSLLLPSEARLLHESRVLQERASSQQTDTEMRITDLAAHNSQLRQSAARMDKTREAQVQALERRLREREAELDQLLSLQPGTPATELNRLRHEQLDEWERRLRAREQAVEWYALDRPDVLGLQESVRELEVALAEGIEHCKDLLRHHHHQQQQQQQHQRVNVGTPAMRATERPVRQPPLLSPMELVASAIGVLPTPNVVAAATAAADAETPPPSTTDDAADEGSSNSVLLDLEQTKFATLQSVQAGMEKLVGFIHMLRVREQEMHKVRAVTEDLERQLADERVAREVAITEAGELRQELVRTKSQALQVQTAATHSLASAVELSASVVAKHGKSPRSKATMLFYVISVLALVFAFAIVWASRALKSIPAMRPS